MRRSQRAALLGGWAALGTTLAFLGTWNRGLAQMMVVAVPTAVALAARPVLAAVRRARAHALKRRVLRRAAANVGPLTTIACAAPPFVHVRGCLRRGEAADELEVVDDSGSLRLMLGALVNKTGGELQPGTRVVVTGPATWGPAEAGTTYRTSTRRLIVAGAPGAPASISLVA